MQVIIGVDPHKASHTAVAISTTEDELARKKVRATRTQVDQLLAWAEPFPTRLWAIEGADGMGYLLARQLVATGEHVLNVAATLAARTRLLGSGRSTKNDPNDALSVAVTALGTRDLRPVQPVGHSEVLRLLAKRNTDIGNQRTRLVCRMHALLLELAAGGIAKEINASDVDRSSPRSCPRRRPSSSATTSRSSSSPTSAASTISSRPPTSGSAPRSPHRARQSPTSSGSARSGRHAHRVTGDIRRFPNRDRYAAYNGTAPVEFSSGGRTVHRLSQRGNRNLNHALHMAVICQLRHPGSDGRVYFDRRLAEGRTKKEALRSLKRHVSNAVYRQLVADAARSRP